MEQSSSSVEELRKAFEQAREVAPASEVRAAAVKYYKARAAQGATQQQAARELGVNQWTLSKWNRHAAGASQDGARGAGQQSQAAESRPAPDALRAEIESLGPRGPSRRFPSELKGRILEWVRGELAKGVSSSVVADQLGIPWESIAKWLGRRSTSNGAAARMQAVRVVGTVAAAGEVTSRGPVLRSPGGFVVEGLDVVMLAELLRRLG